jgi:hypothetical protein
MIHPYVSQWRLSKKIVALIMLVLLLDFSIPDSCDCDPSEIVSTR